jgi:SAM-dependent methyltransferase
MKRSARSLLRRREKACFHTNRGLARFGEILRAVGCPDLVDSVSERLLRRPSVRLLEIGCGEGRLLLDLLARFGDAVELHGINHPDWPVLESAHDLLDTNARHRIVPQRALRRRLPLVHLADATDLRSFPVAGFDLVVSQVVVPHVGKKAAVLEESARLLAPGGTFVHEIDNRVARAPEHPPSELLRLSIRDGDVELSASAYLEGRGVSVRTGRSGDRSVAVATSRKEAAALDLGLELVEGETVCLKSSTTLDVADRWGIRSVYRTRPLPTGA